MLSSAHEEKIRTMGTLKPMSILLPTIIYQFPTVATLELKGKLRLLRQSTVRKLTSNNLVLKYEHFYIDPKQWKK
jgi:hypothetical protein